MANLDQNQGLTPLEKSQVFDFLNFKKKLEKWPFLDQNHGLTPLEKSQFFEFLNFLFL